MRGLGPVRLPRPHRLVRISIADLMVEVAIVAVCLAAAMIARNSNPIGQLLAEFLAAELWLLIHYNLILVRSREPTTREWYRTAWSAVVAAHVMAVFGLSILGPGSFATRRIIRLILITAFGSQVAMWFVILALSSHKLTPRRCPGCRRVRMFLDFTRNEQAVGARSRLMGRHHDHAGCIHCGVRCRRRADRPWRVVARPAPASDAG